MSNDVPPQPKPTTEPPAPPPGGPNAVPGVGGDGSYSRESRDPDPDQNPSPADELPEETRETEDTSTQATEDGGDVPPTQESPA